MNHSTAKQPRRKRKTTRTETMRMMATSQEGVVSAGDNEAG